jgi:hypothetical protein
LAARPDAFLPYLASSLNNLGTMLSALGRRAEAHEAMREAVQFYLTVTRRVPARYLAECRIAVRNLLRRLEENERDWRTDPLIAEATALIERFTPRREPPQQVAG